MVACRRWKTPATITITRVIITEARERDFFLPGKKGLRAAQENPLSGSLLRDAELFAAILRQIPEIGCGFSDESKAFTATQAAQLHTQIRFSKKAGRLTARGRVSVSEMHPKIWLWGVRNESRNPRFGSA